MTCAPEAILGQARRLVRVGSLGTVVFCRVAHADLLPAVVFVLGSRECPAEVSAFTEGVVFVGSRATLAVSGRGCKVFASDSSCGPPGE